MSEMVTTPKGGRPPGAKNKKDGKAFVRAFADKTMHNIHRILDSGDVDATMKMAKFIWGGKIPEPSIALKPIKSLEDAKGALGQIISMEAAGLITSERANSLRNSISAYLEVTKNVDLDARLARMEAAMGQNEQS